MSINNLILLEDTFEEVKNSHNDQLKQFDPSHQPLTDISLASPLEESTPGVSTRFRTVSRSSNTDSDYGERSTEFDPFLGQSSSIREKTSHNFRREEGPFGPSSNGGFSAPPLNIDVPIPAGAAAG